MAPTLHQLPLRAGNRPSHLFFSTESDLLPAVNARTGFTNHAEPRRPPNRTLPRQTPMLDYCSPAKMDTGVVSSESTASTHCPSLHQERI